MTLIRLRSLGTTGSIEANCSALIVASELRERLQWPHPINCKTIMLYDGVALGLGLEADATDVNGDDGRESDDAMEGLVLSALDSVPFASIEIVGDGADISLLELAGIASETEGAAVELSDFRAFVKLRPGIQIHPNASRRLIGMLDASNGKFSFADIDLDGTVAEDGGGGE